MENNAFLEMINHDIVDIYRKVGKILRKYGAVRVYIINAKIKRMEQNIVIALEIVVDQLIQYNAAMKALNEELPEVKCEIYDSSSIDNSVYLKEAEEDGIQI